MMGADRNDAPHSATEPGRLSSNASRLKGIATAYHPDKAGVLAVCPSRGSLRQKIDGTGQSQRFGKMRFS